MTKRAALKSLDPATVTLLASKRSEQGPGLYVYTFAHGGRSHTLYSHADGKVTAMVAQVDLDALHTMLHLLNNDIIDKAKDSNARGKLPARRSDKTD